MKTLVNEQEYLAGITQWQDFLKSQIWHDLQLFIADRIEVNRDQLELTDEERQIAVTNSNGLYETADILRGRNREAKMILFAPEEILEELKDIQSQGEEDVD